MKVQATARVWDKCVVRSRFRTFALCISRLGFSMIRRIVIHHSDYCWHSSYRILFCGFQGSRCWALASTGGIGMFQVFWLLLYSIDSATLNPKPLQKFGRRPWDSCAKIERIWGILRFLKHLREIRSFKLQRANHEKMRCRTLLVE